MDPESIPSWLAVFGIELIVATAFGLFGIYIYVQTPKASRWKASFNLAMALLVCALGYNSVVIRRDVSKFIGRKDHQLFAVSIPGSIVHYLTITIGEISLWFSLYRLHRRKKSKRTVFFVAFSVLVRAVSHAILVVFVILGDYEGNKPKYYQGVKISGIMVGATVSFNSVGLSFLFLWHYSSKLRYAILNRKFLQVLGRITMQHALLPTIFVLPSAALFIRQRASENEEIKRLDFTIIHQIFFFSFSISVAYAMYLLNLGPLHYHLGLLSKQAQFSAGEIVQAFRHEKKEEAIVERYLRESYLRVGGVCGCIFDYSDDEFKPSCTFHLDGDTEEVEVSFRPTMIGYRPISLLKRALLRNETVVEGIENLDDISELRPQKFNSRSYICVPVRSAFGKAFICISSTRDVFVDTITAMDIYILELLSQQLVVSLENCRLFNDLANMNQELDMKVADRTEELEKQKMELQEAKLKAEESARAKSIFLANMSHEVRTPASQIISAAELLSGTTLTVEQNGFLDIVISSGKLLLNLLNDILDVSKLDSQKLQLEYAPFNLRQLIKATVEAFTVSRPLYLAYSIDKKLPDILTGDALRLQQIFTNLISNALKFTTKGYVLLEAKMVTLQSDFDGEINEIEFSVTDTGAGISKEKLNVIFQRFEQENTSISRLHGGTGLGLSISQDLCGLMGSRLHAESDVGVGSKFYFTVRLRSPQNSAKVEQSRQLDDPKQKLLLLLANPTEYSTKSSKPLLQVQLDNCGIGDITSRNCTSAELQEISDTSQDSFDMIVLDLLSAPKELSFYITHIHRLRIPVIIICDTDQHAELPQNFESNSVHVLRHPYKQSVLEQLVLNHRKNDIRKITTNGVMANVNVNYHVDNIKILLAEDNPVNRKVMTEMFRRLGHSIDVAMNGVEATEMAALTDYDVIFMDVRMPIMSGLEATKRIIAHNESRVDWKKPIIIGLSADALQENREDGLKAGMDEYLSKPVSKDSLVNIINKLCG